MLAWARVGSQWQSSSASGVVLHQPKHMAHSSLASFAPGPRGTSSFKLPFTSASAMLAQLWTAQPREWWDPAICQTGHKQVSFHELRLQLIYVRINIRNAFPPLPVFPCTNYASGELLVQNSLSSSKIYIALDNQGDTYSLLTRSPAKTSCVVSRASCSPEAN